MKNLSVKLRLLSDALIASGEGFGALIDSDILFDQWGLPYLPGRRFKGCLREAARQVQVMLNLSNLQADFDVDQVFGLPGETDEPQVSFSGLYPPQYAETAAWLRYASEQKKLLNSEEVLNSLTSVRYQIAVSEDGVTRDHSLRTIRILNQGFCFNGSITCPDKPLYLNTLRLACRQLEDVGIGAKRKRGFGRVFCEIWDGGVCLTEFQPEEILNHV